ncbi:MAG: dienelactone hydrolase [Pseudonocardiales bacterium]|nr:MAG: dienelactone hydrolase [Pseudonocardiales bacterium]
MADIALFHSVLGVRPGILDAGDRLRSRGHQVLVVDQYDGRVFDDYQQADAYSQQIGGFPELMGRALAAVKPLPDGFLCVGFSNGAGMGEYVALQRPVSGVVMCSGALPVEMIGGDAWPAGVPAQIHCTLGDPLRPAGWAETVARSVTTAGGHIDLHEYPGTGHLFTDASLPDEYDPAAAELLWQRVHAFCQQHGQPAT